MTKFVGESGSIVSVLHLRVLQQCIPSFLVKRYAYTFMVKKICSP